MLEVLNKRYKAISNLFVHTLEDEHHVYPAPISVYVSIEDENKDIKNTVKLGFTSFHDSVLPITYFSLFFYLLSYEYKIETFYVEGLEKVETSTDLHGYTGTYKFVEGSILLNLGEEELYDKYKNFKNKLHSTNSAN